MSNPLHGLAPVARGGGGGSRLLLLRRRPLHVVQVDGPHDHRGAGEELRRELKTEEEVGGHAAQEDGKGAGVAYT